MGTQNTSEPWSRTQATARITDRLNSLLPRRRGCQQCGFKKKPTWTLADGFIAPTVLAVPDREPGTVNYPMALLSCNNCGHVLFFNLIAMGVGDLPFKLTGGKMNVFDEED